MITQNASDVVDSAFLDGESREFETLFRERQTILEMPTKTLEILIGLHLQQPLGIFLVLIEVLGYYLFYITVKTYFSDSFLEYNSLMGELIALFLIPGSLFFLKCFLSARFWYKPKQAKQFIKWQKRALEQIMAHTAPNAIHPEFLCRYWPLIEQLMRSRGGDVEDHYVKLRQEKETYEAYLDINQAEAAIVDSLQQICASMYLHQITIQRTGGREARSKPLIDFSEEYGKLFNAMLAQVKKSFPKTQG